MDTKTVVPQHMLALQKANEVRIATANLKKDVAAGRVDPVALINEYPVRRELEKVAVVDFLTWIPYIGEVKARRMMRGIIHTDTLRLSVLSERTRSEVAGCLDKTLNSNGQRLRGRIGIVAQPVPVVTTAVAVAA